MTPEEISKQANYIIVELDLMTQEERINVLIEALKIVLRYDEYKVPWGDR
jgi:hypothetical protein